MMTRDNLTPAAEAAGSEPVATRPRPRRSRLMAGLVAAAGVLLVVGAFLVLSGREARGEGLVFEIPAGAAATVDVPTLDSAITIPTRIVFRAGETAAITIHNRDSVPHRAGPFVVGAGQSFVQRFPGPGEYPIACSVDPAESIVVTVES